ncbi:MAG: hypothetical protein VXA34_09110 [Gammaproteobacteria bacterium]
MPRKPTKHAVEHRITLGDFERAALTKALTLQAENQRLDAATATLNAVGVAIGGAGGILAGLALMYWKAPDIINGITDAGKAVLDDLTDAVLPKSPVHMRREAQALATRRGEINAKINRYCTSTSPDFDEQKCTLAHAEKDQYFADLEDFRQRVRQAQITEDSFYWRFIFGGLGDIDPYHNDANAGSNMPWWKYFLNFDA